MRPKRNVNNFMFAYSQKEPRDLARGGVPHVQFAFSFWSYNCGAAGTRKGNRKKGSRSALGVVSGHAKRNSSSNETLSKPHFISGCNTLGTERGITLIG